MILPNDVRRPEWPISKHTTRAHGGTNRPGSERYDLIVIGRQTSFRFESQSEPDNTLSLVLKNSPRPVVAVPEKLRAGRSVLVAYDGSLQAARTLQAFVALRPQGVSDVHILSVDRDREEAASRADRAVAFLRFHQVSAIVHAVDSSEPAQAILDHIESLGAELVVMAAYGKSSLREFFFGSVTREMLKESSAPLFLYH